MSSKRTLITPIEVNKVKQLQTTSKPINIPDNRHSQQPQAPPLNARIVDVAANVAMPPREAIAPQVNLIKSVDEIKNWRSKPGRARSSARIERRPPEPEVPGSNPGGPATR